MDALEFLMERNRLCGSYRGCVGCPFGAAECVITYMTSEHTCKRIIAIVEQWSKEHPRKTRQSVFLARYPEASIGDDGVLRLCPFLIDASYRNNDGSCKAVQRQCSDCHKEFWGQEVE